MHSYKLIAMLGAFASAKDLVSNSRRELAVGDEYDGFQNVIWAVNDHPLRINEDGDSVGTVSVATSWNEQGSDDLTLYYGLIVELTIN